MAMKGKGLFVVRAVIEDPSNRERFDDWYQHDHLPDALTAFGAQRAWRAWSSKDPSVHTAFYEFESGEAAAAIEDSEAIKDLIADFDRNWGDAVKRSREVLVIVDHQSPQSDA
ncbi:MAG: hypothetical protein ACR2PG_12255 [Hyphomicrobiaceae bacterium]